MKDPSTRVSIYRRVAKHSPLGGEFGLHKIEEGERLFEKPTLLCCGGGGTLKDENVNHRKLASGFAKLGHAMLSTKDHVSPEDSIDVLSVSYPGTTEKTQSNIAGLTRSVIKGKTHFSQSADNLMYDYINPLLTEKDGTRKDMLVIQKQLRNINIMAHSYGGVFVKDFSNALRARLKELFNKPEERKEIAKAMAQVLVVTAGTAAPLGASNLGFTVIDVLNSQDRIPGQYYPGEDMQTKMINKLMQDENRMRTTFPKVPKDALNVLPIRLSRDPKLHLHANPKSRNYLVYASSTVIEDDGKIITKDAVDISSPRSNSRGLFYDEECNDVPKVKDHDLSRHQVPSYFHYRAGHNGFMLRTAISSALANGINNAITNQKYEDLVPLPSPKRLLKCPKKLLYTVETVEMPQGSDKDKEIVIRDFTKVAKMIDYDNRIQAAMGADRGR